MTTRSTNSRSPHERPRFARTRPRWRVSARRLARDVEHPAEPIEPSLDDAVLLWVGLLTGVGMTAIILMLGLSPGWSDSLELVLILLLAARKLGEAFLAAGLVRWGRVNQGLGQQDRPVILGTIFALVLVVCWLMASCYAAVACMLGAMNFD